MLTRGSEWNKWDLHLHSKYSLEDRTKMEIEDIFKEAIDKNLKMISITDHCNFDGLDEIWEVYENGKCNKGNYKSLTNFLPGIELKTDKGKHGVHIISIFPQYIKINGNRLKADKKNLYDNFCSPLGLTESKISSNGKGYAKGLFSSVVNFDEAIKLTHDLGGLVIIHGGDKHGSIEKEISHTKKSLPTSDDLYDNLDITKKDIISSKIDIIELPNFNKSQAKNAMFYKKEFGKPCIIGSDSHEADDYKRLGEKSTWIKANNTYEGLKQALIDYENRICLNEIPEQLNRIKNKPTKFIDEVIVDWEKNYSGEKGTWFRKIRIPLNSGLVSIIGNKGNGKSALAEIIAWNSNSKNYKKFAFLNEQKFLKGKLSSNFVSKIKWKSSDNYIERNLYDKPNENDIERVQCIPQQYFEEICTDTELNKFTKEINSVIFSRLNEEDKNGYRSLEDLIYRYTKSTEENINYYQNKLSEVNSKIIKLENRKTIKNIELQKSIERNAIEELELHERICPTKINKPEIDKQLQEKYEEITKDLKEIDCKIKKYDENIVELRKKLNKINLLDNKISDLYTRFNSESIKLAEELKNYNLNIYEVIKIEFNNSGINLVRHKIIDEIERIDKILNNEINGLNISFATKNKEKEKLVQESNERFEIYDKYLNEYKKWENLHKEKEYKVTSIKKEINYITGEIENDLNILYGERSNLSHKIYEEKQKIVQVYIKFKAPVDKFLEDNQELLNNYSIDIRAGLVLSDDFQKNLFNFINKKKRNAFRDDDYQLYRTISLLNDIEEKQEYSKIPELILKKIKEYSETSEQIKENKLLDFYNYLYGMKYINSKYELISDGKTLDKLSPGERGALLLIFYLLLDLSDIPLIIDQPEDNLDNQSVAKILVPFIQAAKNRRQIILVTHNPNLAVVSDSDQIIHVEIDKENKQEVHVESNGIEDSSINNCIVDILEGTMTSFRKRDEKYM